jgi:hypothetical protein
MNWLATGEEPTVRSTILDDTAAAKSSAQRWGSETDAKIGAVIWIRGTDRSCSCDCRVGAAAVCINGNELRSRCSCLGTILIEVFTAELWAIRLALDMEITKTDSLQMHRAKTVAVFSN